MDESAAARLHRRLSLKHGSDEDSTPEVLAQQVQAVFSKTLIDEFTKVNVRSERSLDDGGVPVAPVLIVEGEFIAIDEGNKSKRIMIGFGRGASDIKTHVVVSSLVKGSKTVVLEFNLNSASGKKPGAAATMGAEYGTDCRHHQRPAQNGRRKMGVRLKGRNPRSPACDDQSVDQKD